MSKTPHDQPPALEIEIQDYLLDCQIRKLAAKTQRIHTDNLRRWRAFCGGLAITATEQTNAKHLRLFLAGLEGNGHNEGGIAHIYRSVKAFLLWYEREYEPAAWKSPTRKIKLRQSQDAPLDPLTLKDFDKMLGACEHKTLVGDRDRALLYMLMDTGLRQQEITDLDMGDVSIASGEVLVRSGKGRKPRTVIIGATTSRALLHYLRHRGFVPPTAPLWIGRTKKRLNKNGIRQVVRRRAVDAGVHEPGMHEFRRAFAINSLRNGMDVITLQRLLGHSTLAVINRYLKLLSDDLKSAHAKYGVVDNL